MPAVPVGIREAEAEVIAGRLLELGMAQSTLILQAAAMNTGQNVIFGMERLAQVMDLASISSLLLIGKLSSARRYLMTVERHWPGLRLSLHGVNYFGVPADCWHEHEEFRARVIDEFARIPRYLQQDFLREIAHMESFPDREYCEALVKYLGS